MPIRTVTWTSFTKLPCADCGSREVILCLPPEIIKPRLCPESELGQGEGVTEVPTWRTIEAELKSFEAVPQDCRTLFRYVFAYDSTLVIDELPLANTHIEGVVCKDCLTDWVEDRAGGEVYLRSNDDGTITLVSQHGCQYTFGTGAETLLSVQDTPTINFEVSSDFPQLLTGSVVVSPNEGNSLTALGNGLYVPPGSAPEISAEDGNQIVDLPDGLYVPESPLAQAAIINNQKGLGQWIDNKLGHVDAAPATPTTINAGSPVFRGNEAVATITNDSVNFAMKVLFNFNWLWIYNLVGADNDMQQISRRAYLSIHPSPANPVALNYLLPETHRFQAVPGVPDNRFSFGATFSRTVTIAPNSSISIKGVAELNFEEGNATQIDVTALSTSISYLGVAVPP